jgi:hypothetical protein
VARAAAAAANDRDRARGGAKARSASDRKASAAQDDGSAPTDVEIASQPDDYAVSASPAELPFTGFQLVLVMMVGLGVLAGGALLRRATRERRA